VIALFIATDTARASKKEDLATLKQVKAELCQCQYHYETYLSTLTPKSKENKTPPPKREKTTATSPPHGKELFLPNGDSSMYSVGYALPAPYKSYQFSP
jgi:hypothetical protein